MTQSSVVHKTNFTKHDSSPKPVIPLEIPIKPTKASSSSTNSEKSNNKPSISKTSTKSYSTSTLNIETSSSVQIIEPTSSKPMVQSTPLATNVNTSSSNVTSASSTITLEPSKTIESESTAASSIPTPTESLPSIFTKTLSTTEKSIIHPTMNTFSKNSGRTFAWLRVSYKFFHSIRQYCIQSIMNSSRGCNEQLCSINFLCRVPACSINFLCSAYGSLRLPTQAWDRPRRYFGLHGNSRPGYSTTLRTTKTSTSR